MMPQVHLSFGEQFLNWYTSTNLYIRGQKGKSWGEQRALDAKLASQLNQWFEPIRSRIRKEAIEDCLAALKADDMGEADDVIRRLLSKDEDALEVGIRGVGVDESGELELILTIDNQEASCWISREFWKALGEMWSKDAL